MEPRVLLERSGTTTATTAALDTLLPIRSSVSVDQLDVFIEDHAAASSAR